MSKKPIYVEIDIQAPIEKAWDYTQKPQLHEQWDLRFTSIHIYRKEHLRSHSVLPMKRRSYQVYRLVAGEKARGSIIKKMASLTASHRMTILGIPFLQIDYHIERNKVDWQEMTSSNEKVLIESTKKE
ncbi:hypothetical protein AK833_00020 [Lysinibacillus sp. F5]|nr:hypothetical protein AK833_00020 [Lysinibacillus sp. F5]